MQRFEYLRANTIEEAVSFLTMRRGVARLLAGGTDLVPGLKNETLAPRCLVDVKALPGLDAIRLDGESLRLGALTGIRTIETSALLQDSMPFNVLAQAAATLGSVQICNRATIGGKPVPRLAVGGHGPGADRAGSDCSYPGPGRDTIGAGRDVLHRARGKPSSCRMRSSPRSGSPRH